MGPMCIVFFLCIQCHGVLNTDQRRDSDTDRSETEIEKNFPRVLDSFYWYLYQWLSVGQCDAYLLQPAIHLFFVLSKPRSTYVHGLERAYIGCSQSYFTILKIRQAFVQQKKPRERKRPRHKEFYQPL